MPVRHLHAHALPSALLRRKAVGPLWPAAHPPLRQHSAVPLKVATSPPPAGPLDSLPAQAPPCAPQRPLKRPARPNAQQEAQNVLPALLAPGAYAWGFYATRPLLLPRDGLMLCFGATPPPPGQAVLPCCLPPCLPCSPTSCAPLLPRSPPRPGQQGHDVWPAAHSRARRQRARATAVPRRACLQQLHSTCGVLPVQRVQLCARYAPAGEGWEQVGGHACSAASVQRPVRCASPCRRIVPCRSSLHCPYCVVLVQALPSFLQCPTPPPRLTCQ